VTEIVVVVVPWAGDRAVREADAEVLMLAAIEVDGVPLPADTEVVLRAADFIDPIAGKDVTKLTVRVEDRSL
jgi:hypothetical protein